MPAVLLSCLMQSADWMPLLVEENRANIGKKLQRLLRLWALMRRYLVLASRSTTNVNHQQQAGECALALIRFWQKYLRT